MFGRYNLGMWQMQAGHDTQANQLLGIRLTEQVLG